MSTGRCAHSRVAGGHGWHVDDVQQLNVEDEVGLGWNAWVLGIAGRAAQYAVRQLVGDEEAAFAAHAYALKALVPAGNDAAIALREEDGLTGSFLDGAVGVLDGLQIVSHDGLLGVVG